MKTSFSTVGCPNWMWSEIVSAAKDLGYNGIELRGLGDDLFVPNIKIFKPENIGKTKENLRKTGLVIACVASDCLLHMDDKDYTAAAREYIKLAGELSCKYVRVLCDTWGYPGKSVNKDLARSRLIELKSDAESSGVTLLVETNGVWADTKELARLIEDVGSPNVQVLWDINHPVIYFGETPEITWKNIGKYVKHMHLKDSKMIDGKLSYKMIGYGELPLKECLKLLKDTDYDGFLSLEWTKRWNEELEDAGIVFSHFAYSIKKMLNEL